MEQTYEPDLFKRYKKEGKKITALDHSQSGVLTIGFEDGSRIMISPELRCWHLRIEPVMKIECWNVGGHGYLGNINGVGADPDVIQDAFNKASAEEGRIMVPYTSEFLETIWRSSPQYLQAYKEGYEQAKAEMLEKIKNMQALYESSTTPGGEG